MPPTAVSVDVDGVTASLVLQDFAVPDYIGEATGQGDLVVPATVSMTIQWFGAGAALQIVDQANQFAARWTECQSTIAWSASEDGLSFVSDAAETSVTRFAQLGRERTGVFADPRTSP